MSDALIRVENVSKKFCRSLKRSLWYGLNDLKDEFCGHRVQTEKELRSDEFWAVKDVSFEVKRGECLGLIGRNGAGKTTLLRMLNGLIKPDHGRIEMRGRVGALIALGAGFNPLLSGRENIYVNASVLGLTKKEVDEKIDEIVEFAELEEFIDMPVQSYSSGMSVRLGFSVAASLSPDILLLDEVLAVGDARFRSKCFSRIAESLKSSAVIFVSHDAWSIKRVCDFVLYLDRGSKVYLGEVLEGMNLYTNLSCHANDVNYYLNCIDFITNVLVNAKEKLFYDKLKKEKMNIKIIVSCNSIRKIKTGICHCNVSTIDEVVVIQCDFSHKIYFIEEGCNNIEFTIPDISLATGSYMLSLAIWDDSGKNLLVNVRNFSMISFQNNINYGCSNVVYAI